MELPIHSKKLFHNKKLIKKGMPNKVKSKTPTQNNVSKISISFLYSIKKTALSIRLTGSDNTMLSRECYLTQAISCLVAQN